MSLKSPVTHPYNDGVIQERLEGLEPACGLTLSKKEIRQLLGGGSATQWWWGGIWPPNNLGSSDLGSGLKSLPIPGAITMHR